MSRPVQSLTDSEITTLVISGRKEEYAELVKRYQGKLLRYTTYLLGDSDEAMDAVQDTFIRAYVNLRSFDPSRAFGSWIYRIAHNQVVNRQRARRPQTSLTDNQLDAIKDPGSLEDDYLKKELTERAHRCLAQMPKLYGAPLTLYYIEDKSYQEISDILRLPLGTVGARINRAKKYLRAICQKN